MTYEKRLSMSKILVSVGLCIFALIPLTLNFSNHMVPGLYGHLIALPIMLWVIWGKKLHGTGRSVRLMAYLGLAFTTGLYMAATSHLKSESETHKFGHENVMLAGVVFTLLLLGVFISIRRGADT